VRCNTPVVRIDVRGERAVGVTTAGGDAVPARRAVLADVGAPALYRQLVGAEHLSRAFLDDIGKFQYDAATVKVDWALGGPVPWSAEPATRAGTVHVAESIDAMTDFSGQLARGLIPAHPFLVFGQMNVADPTRSPAGTETGWAYTHVPQRVRGDASGTLAGRWDTGDGEAFADRMEAEVETLAPGFQDLILDRHVLTPRALEEANANLAGGSVNGGTAQLHQQLIFRPTPGLGRPETPIKRLYLASASAHPGGGVHGAPGANAAHAALAAARTRRAVMAVGGSAAALWGGRAMGRRRAAGSGKGGGA
jgi:phytoene dehydrogenase-like protein